VLAQVLEVHPNLPLCLTIGVSRETDSAWFGLALEARGDVDPVAMDIVALDDHIPQVDADAEYEPLVFIGCRLSLGHAVLPGHRAGDSIHHAGELDQQAVADELDDPAMMLGDERLQALLAQLGQMPKRPRLIRTHKAGIADYVSGKDGGQPALGPVFGHGKPPDGNLQGLAV